MKEKKNELREALRGEAREAGHAGEKNVAAERVEALPEFAAARTVALYHALPGEVPTAEMLARWGASKRLALPVITGPGEMHFREYTGEVRPGPFGIAEPAAGAVVPPEQIDLALVPGMAFDAAGRRLGRGRGFYDRYLSQPAALRIYKVGMCPPGALMPEVPAEPHDVAMDKIILAD